MILPLSHICILKTHINTINDFDYQFIEDIIQIQKKYKFFIMEDGKFSDIGNTFRNQLTKEIFKINNWSDCITCHGIAGSSILQEYKDLNNDDLKGIFLVAQMSNRNNLINQEYTNNIIELSKFQNEPPSLTNTTTKYKYIYDFLNNYQFSQLS